MSWWWIPSEAYQDPDLDWCGRPKSVGGTGTTRRASITAKLSDGKAQEIRKMWPKWSYAELAKKYGVSKALIKNVVKGRAWK